MRLLLLLLLCLPAWAGQIGFDRQYSATEATFAYIWQARSGANESLMFKLPIEDLQRGNQEFGGYNFQDQVKEVRAAMEAEAAKLSTPQLKVTMEPTMGDGMRMEISGLQNAVTPERTASIKARLQQVQDEAQAAYLRENFYRTNDDGRIMPDHPTLVRRYAPALAPVVAAIRAQTVGREPREVINFVMGWLQSIPYDPLTNRYATVGIGGGAGYQTPYGVILNNLGDCDSKSVTLLAIVHALYPELPLAMVYVPDHAFAAIGLPQGPHDYALRLGTQVLVLADPTGPALTVLGEVEPNAKAVLAGGGGWHLLI